MLAGSQVQARRAIEALRAGVPNRDAVLALGSAQTEIEESFRERLQEVTDGIERGEQARGLLVAGDFGTGKSHLLEYLQQAALQAGFVTSKIVISKDTPLHDPAKLYRAAIESAQVPDKQGAVLTAVAGNLSFDSEPYQELVRWAHRSAAQLNSRFPASIYLYERIKDEEIRDRLISYWAGDPLMVSDLRRWLREYGEAASYRLEPIGSRELALQRFLFTPRLIHAAGYRGWLLLLDEVELIGRYSLKQRARSYAELARWAGRLQGEVYPGLVTMMAITSDFAEEMLRRRNDSEAIPGRLRATGVEADSLLASRAERGMRFIERDSLQLLPPSDEAIRSTAERIQQLHGEAFGWSPPALPNNLRAESSRSMRQYVRGWINQWDLKRLYPGVETHVAVHELRMDYSENPDLEGPGEDTSA